ncbi:MAG: DUF4231 domain-containing protein [Pyramidobacter sp.]|nr:DUF4231 domain-containing protein [Pyramidobacter sp.]MBQ8129397.1 DUF4231 domain-containing protein [Clostridia bacterium]
MDESDYIKDRLDPLIAWYDRKSTWDKRWYIGLKVAECVLAASVTLGAGFMDGPLPLRLFVSACGALLVVAQGLHAACKYHENWVSARTACEELKAEKALWAAGVGQYDGEDERDIAMLGERCEKIIQTEHERWISRRHTPPS